MTKDYNTPRNLLGFLNVLLRLTEQNIKFINNKKTNEVCDLEKYIKEIKKIQDLINSFNFE